MVARHLALGNLRRARRSPIFDIADFTAINVIDDRPGAAEQACTREEIDLLFAAISTLSARTREVYLLRKFEDLSQKEIGARLGISMNTVEVHVGRANRHCGKFPRNHRIFPGAGARPFSGMPPAFGVVESNPTKKQRYMNHDPQIEATSPGANCAFGFQSKNQKPKSA